MCVCVCVRVCVSVPVCDDSVTLASRADWRGWRQFFVGVAGNGKLSCNPGNIRLRTMAEVGNSPVLYRLLVCLFLEIIFSSLSLESRELPQIPACLM